MSRVAGSSARAEYERLRQHRLTRLRHRWWAVLGGMLVAFFAGYVIVELVPAAAFRAFDSIAPGTADHAPEIPSYVTVGVGAVFAAAGAWSLTRPSAAERAWRKGAEGEETVGRRLESLRAEGVHVTHDVPIPGSRANIDHLVVSPHGVVTIETKAYRGRLAVRRMGRELWIDGRNRSHLLDQALHQADVVRRVLSGVGLDHVPVTPVLCFVGTHVPWLVRRTARGVVITPLRRLRKVLFPGDSPVIEPGDLNDVVRLFDESENRESHTPQLFDLSADMTTPECARCGKPMVERRRRADGVRFYGCSGFPSCRYTRPIDEAAARRAT